MRVMKSRLPEDFDFKDFLNSNPDVNKAYEIVFEYLMYNAAVIEVHADPRNPTKTLLATITQDPYYQGVIAALVTLISVTSPKNKEALEALVFLTEKARLYMLACEGQA